MSDLQQALDLIARGSDEILKREELEARLKLGRPLRSGKMEAVPEGGLPALTHDALVRVRFVNSNSLHWMVWDQRRQCLLDPEDGDSHWSEYHVLHQIEVAS